MLSFFTVVIVASDSALLRSLAFALEVDGYRVETHQTWQSAQVSLSRALCVIVDGEICRKDAEARQALLKPGNRMILLDDGTLPPLQHADAWVLTKPLAGSDIMAVVDGFRMSGQPAR